MTQRLGDHPEEDIEEENELNVEEEIVEDSDSHNVDISSESSENSEEEREEGIIDTRGVKHQCPLNVLQSFHAVGGFPPDLLHDIFEGVISIDLLGITKILIEKGWFSVEDYNDALKSLTFPSYENADKPMGIPLGRRSLKLKGIMLDFGQPTCSLIK